VTSGNQMNAQWNRAPGKAASTSAPNEIPVAAIVLAAGGSVRMGQLKQLLPVGGQPMVRRVAEAVCAAELAQVLVVVGARADQVAQALVALPVDVVANEQWAEGMSTSLRAGLQALRPEIQAVLIVLADQPALTPHLLKALVARYHATGAPIVAPFFRGQHGNPVLFDRSLFPELLAVEGDQGGRALLVRHHERMECIDIDDPAAVLDVDTRQDYEKAQELRLAFGPQQKDRASAAWAALIATTLAGFLTPFMDSATTVALPSIGHEFSIDAVSLSWIRTAYLLAAAMLLVPFGKIADIYGRKKIFTYGIAIFTLAAVLAGFSTAPAMLISVRVLQGFGSAMIFGNGVAILTSVFPPEKRGRVLGINVAAVYLGLSLGPSIGGVLTQQLGWRSIFFATALLGLIVILFALWRLTGEWAEAKGETFDLTGSLIYAPALVALMYGFSRLPGMLGAGLIAVGILGLAVFAAWEMRIRNPVLNIKLLANNRPFAFSNLAALINYGATSAVAFLLSLYLQYVQALDPQQAGLVLIAQPIMQAVLSPLTGWLSERIEPRIVASAGMAFTTVGLALLILIGPITPLWAIIADLILLGVGFALFSSPNMNAIMGSVEKTFYGVASGMLATMRLMGQTLSMGIATLLFALYIGRVEITPESYASFLTATKTAFAVFAALCTAGIFASLSRGNIREET
jgi:EmrB/QacA subfamily drug resistance transporter